MQTTYYNLFLKNKLFKTIYSMLNSLQQQQQPSLIPLSGVGYMDQITPECFIINQIWIQLISL